MSPGQLALSAVSMAPGTIRDVSSSATSVVQFPALLDKPFVVRPGFSPVPSKLVTQKGGKVYRFERFVGRESSTKRTQATVTVGQPFHSDFSAKKD